MKVIINESIKTHAQYLAWKRKNVTLRGIANPSALDSENGGGARFGMGLYTAFLSNKDMAKQYGTVRFVVNAIPKNPKVFNNTNDAEIWIQTNLYSKMGGMREFEKKSNIAEAMFELGYDGLVIRGREMVNYAPPKNVMYFQNERQLQMYFENNIEE